MVERVPVAVFSDGRASVEGFTAKSREAVLALPLYRMLVKVLAFHGEEMERGDEIARAELASMTPYPDAELTVSCEMLREDASSKCVAAFAVPEESVDDIAAALDEAKLEVVRIDALVFGELRALWPEISSAGRRVVAIPEGDYLALAVLDGESLLALRSAHKSTDLKNEVLFLMIEAEKSDCAAPLDEIVAVGGIEADWGGIAPVRRVAAPPRERVIEAVSERTGEEGTLNALPASWGEVLEETRFKRKLRKWAVSALAVWFVAAAAMFAVPAAYGFMADRVKGLSREHSKKYREVSEMREKVKLVRKYSDHSTGVLEILKTVSERLPQGVVLTSWNFKRDEDVRFSGEAAVAASVYEFKDALSSAEGAEGEPLFAEVVLTGPSAGKGGSQRFDIECRFAKEDGR
ncbi:MAG: PilN domain-containing protein [Kiritimatiellae bacterium]|nr:PilN domain-containing protein [Kiritimatiellia bacterium]